MVSSFVNKAQTINATSALVLPDRSSLNQKRLSFIITNTGATTIWLAIDAEAVVSAGIPLYPGGSLERVVAGVALPPQKAINATSSAIGGTISIFEEVLN